MFKKSENSVTVTVLSSVTKNVFSDASMKTIY